jgi:hypothetical protein
MSSFVAAASNPDCLPAIIPVPFSKGLLADVTPFSEEKGGIE